MDLTAYCHSRDSMRQASHAFCLIAFRPSNLKDTHTGTPFSQRQSQVGVSVDLGKTNARRVPRWWHKKIRASTLNLLQTCASLTRTRHNLIQDIPKSKLLPSEQDFHDAWRALEPHKVRNGAAECPRKASLAVPDASVFVFEPFRWTKYSSGGRTYGNLNPNKPETRCMAWQKPEFRKGHSRKTISPREGRAAAPGTRQNRPRYRLTMLGQDA